MPDRKHVLITGSPRSGNHSAVRYYQWHGRDVRLLDMGADGVASWILFRDHQALDGFYPTRRQDYRFDRVFHLIRDPIRVIRSLHRMLCPGADLPKECWSIMRQIGHPLPSDRLGAALTFWITIVSQTEADEVIRLEDWDPPFVEGAHLEHPRLTWGEVLERQPRLGERARVLAADFGYPVEEDHGG